MMHALDRRCLTCAHHRIGDVRDIGICRLTNADVGHWHACTSWHASGHATISEAVAQLRHLLVTAAAHPHWPADSAILTAEAVREVAERWRDAAALLTPALACVAERLAAEIDALALAAERAAPFLPTPHTPEAAA